MMRKKNLFLVLALPLLAFALRSGLTGAPTDPPAGGKEAMAAAQTTQMQPCACKSEQPEHQAECTAWLKNELVRQLERYPDYYYRYLELQREQNGLRFKRRKSLDKKLQFLVGEKIMTPFLASKMFGETYGITYFSRCPGGADVLVAKADKKDPEQVHHGIFIWSAGCFPAIQAEFLLYENEEKAMIKISDAAGYVSPETWLRLRAELPDKHS